MPFPQHPDHDDPEDPAQRPDRAPRPLGPRPEPGPSWRAAAHRLARRERWLRNEPHDERDAA
jgi:hypothetical protein